MAYSAEALRKINEDLINLIRKDPKAESYLRKKIAANMPQSEDDDTELEEESGFSGFIMNEGYFQFGTHAIPGDYTINYKKIQKGLSNVGLNCSDNNEQNISSIAETVRKSIPTHGMLCRYAEDSLSTEASKYNWKIDEINSLYEPTAALMSKADEIKKRGIYVVNETQVEHTLNKTTMGAFKAAFSQIANTIGSLGSDHFEPKQLTAQIAQMLEDLTKVEQEDYHKTDKGFSFLMGKLKDPYKGNPHYSSNAILGLNWNYDLVIHNYKDKKKEIHKTSYTVKRQFMLFSYCPSFADICRKVDVVAPPCATKNT